MDLEKAAPITPSHLKRGDTIAFISPSLRLNDIFPAPIERAKQFFEKQGFKVVIIYDKTVKPGFEDQIIQRCEEVHAAFRDPAINAIICTIGGSHANELLRHLDYELIRANPKIFCGFSDITILHCAIYTQTGLRTFYGPTILDPLGSYPEPHAFTSQNFLRTLTASGLEPLGPVPVSAEWSSTLDDYFLVHPSAEVPRKMKPNAGWRWLRSGTAKGRIFGGCLSTLMRLTGTKFWPDTRGRVLFLETASGPSIKEGPPLSTVRAEMAHMRNLGVFDDIEGLIIGRPYGYDEDALKEYDEIVLNQTRGCSFPILVDVDIGHTTPILTVPLDTLVELDSSSNRFDILEPSVK